MSHALLTPPVRRISAFDELVSRFADRETSFSETEALKASHWDMGEDGRLREDVRFRQTPWGRWMLSRSLLANEALHAAFVHGLHHEVPLSEALAALTVATGRPCVFCPADPRFVLDHGRLRLSARELTDRPFIEDDVTELQKFVTHLPVHSLRATAASEPAGEWGPGAQEQHIETLGWVRVNLYGRGRLNDRMFVAQIEGHSMDDSRSGLVNGGLAVFELWPAGSKQNLNVLVRGAFTDPETGSYAVKKYVGDVRDAEGRHHRITLVSLNPDKLHYPDIELEVQHEEEVTVVARVVQALSPEEFARQPKPPRRRGRRNLSDPDEQAARARRLRTVAARFFEAGQPTGSAEGNGVGTVEQQARLVCLDAESGGLCVETLPLSWLPPFAKQLAVATASQAPIVLLASNLRSRTARTPVPPSSAPYRWSAPGHEDILDDELAVLEVPGLSSDRPALFRVDAAGVGQPMTGSVISAGGAYRLLLPPTLIVEQPPVGELHDLAKGWRLWECVIPGVPGFALRDCLQSLGLELGKAAPEVRWVLRSPAAYGQTPRGEAYPVFSASEGPVVAIDGVRCTRHGELTLLLVGGEACTTLPLGPGTSWIVALQDLAPHRYVLQVLHERTRFAPVSLPFVIAEPGTPPLVAQISVRWAGADIAPEADGTFAIEANWATTEPFDTLQISAPPLWPFEVWWDDGRRRRLDRLSASASGLLDLTALEGSLPDLLRHCTLGSLGLEGGELGRVELRHVRRLSVAEIRLQMQALADERRANLSALDGQFPLLRSLWIHPILALLGYAWHEASEADLTGAPAASTALQLLESDRDADGRIRPHLTRALVLVTSTCDFNATDLFSARYFADQLCMRWGVSEAFLTDGLRWAQHQHRSQWPLRVQHLDQVVGSPDLFSFYDFLRDFANPGAVEG